MKIVVLLYLPVFGMGAVRGVDMRNAFNQWVESFGKKYDGVHEFVSRFKIWTENHRYIETHNSQIPPPSFVLGHNQFSDLTADEYRQLNKLGALHKRQENPSLIKVSRRLREVPNEVNWVEKGAIGTVKNQGMCGSCWAFSAIGAIEAAHFIDTGNLTALSEQQLVDCDNIDLGCMGGLMDNAFTFLQNSTGVCAETDYPYVGHKRWLRGCAIEKGLCSSIEHTRVVAFVDIPSTVTDLVEAVAIQPVSVGIEASLPSFQFYKSGVYSDASCGSKIDHGVLVVGYGTDESVDYFLVRNSWGPTWGDNGYIRMARESAQVNGTCGILAWASRPLLRNNLD